MNLKLFKNLQSNLRADLPTSFFVFLNLFIFAFILTVPILWLNREVLLHRFFWSMNTPETFVLQSGFSWQDFLKPFYSTFVDGTFRTRQFSYFIELVTFKIQNFFQLGFFQNPFFVLLHLMNTLLAGVMIYFLTNNRRTAVFGSLLFLNAGVAIATILFPFRNAKLLVVTLFLLTWLIFLKCHKNEKLLSMKNHWQIYSLTLLAFFTDETALFLFPIILFHWMNAKKIPLKEALRNRWLWLTGGTFAFLTALFYGLSKCLEPTQLTETYSSYFANMTYGLLHPFIFLDVFKSFAFYFLPNNFGHWDLTFLGIASLIAFGILCVLAVTGKSTNRSLVYGLLSLVFLKALLLPHSAGLLKGLMPDDAHFPCLFYFTYYYTYSDGLLFTIIFSLALNKWFNPNKTYLFLFGLMSVINSSNAYHLRHGPLDAIKYHQWDSVKSQEVVSNANRTEEILSKHKNVYLSFPTGDDMVIKGRFNDNGPLPAYARIIPILYLKNIESGHAIISLKNIPQKKDFINADYFYDIDKHELINLREIKIITPDLDEPKLMVKKGLMEGRILSPNKNMTVYFFIKGKCRFDLTINGKTETHQQFYGQSYQVFSSEIPSDKMTFTLNVITPTNESLAYVFGPFVK